MLPLTRSLVELDAKIGVNFITRHTSRNTASVGNERTAYSDVSPVGLVYWFVYTYVYNFLVDLHVCLSICGVCVQLR